MRSGKGSLLVQVYLPIFRGTLAPWHQVETVKDYDLYCHYVAGLVGVGLSNLFAGSGDEEGLREGHQAATMRHV